MQNYFYDLHDQLVKAEIFKKDGTKETWAYIYDVLGRRGAKYRVGEDSAKADETCFVWDGSHLLQEVHSDGRYTYIYTDPDSYEPLVQVRDWTTEDGENRQQTHYFHCDHIGIPREMTDKDGNLLWFGNYTGWGRLKEETTVTDSAYQPFRLQNQYADRETVCMTTSSGIMSRSVEGSLTKTRLGWLVLVTSIGLYKTVKCGLTH